MTGQNILKAVFMGNMLEGHVPRGSQTGNP